MARKFQTYARPSTTNASTERRGYKFLYVEPPDVRCQKISGIMINLPFGGGNNLREVLMPICRASRKVLKCQECLRLRSG